MISMDKLAAKNKAAHYFGGTFLSPLIWMHSLPKEGLSHPAPVALLTWMLHNPLTFGCDALDFPALLGFQKV